MAGENNSAEVVLYVDCAAGCSLTSGIHLVQNEQELVEEQAVGLAAASLAVDRMKADSIDYRGLETKLTRRRPLGGSERTMMAIGHWLRTCWTSEWWSEVGFDSWMGVLSEIE